MKNLLARFAKDESGATAIEYGLIAGLIAVTIVAILGTAGDNLYGIFETISNKLGSAAPK